MQGAAYDAAAAEMLRAVSGSLGTVAQRARVYIVSALSKTRSGKLRQALAEGGDPGDLSTLDDPNALERSDARAGTEARSRLRAGRGIPDCWQCAVSKASIRTPPRRETCSERQSGRGRCGSTSPASVQTMSLPAASRLRWK